LHVIRKGQLELNIATRSVRRANSVITPPPTPRRRTAQYDRTRRGVGFEGFAPRRHTRSCIDPGGNRGELDARRPQRRGAHTHPRRRPRLQGRFYKKKRRGYEYATRTMGKGGGKGGKPVPVELPPARPDQEGDRLHLLLLLRRGRGQTHQRQAHQQPRALRRPQQPRPRRPLRPGARPHRQKRLVRHVQAQRHALSRTLRPHRARRARVQPAHLRNRGSAPTIDVPALPPI
jgi:hypothetical protein